MKIKQKADIKNKDEFVKSLVDGDRLFNENGDEFFYAKKQTGALSPFNMIPKSTNVCVDIADWSVYQHILYKLVNWEDEATKKSPTMCRCEYKTGRISYNFVYCDRFDKFNYDYFDDTDRPINPDNLTPLNLVNGKEVGE